MVSKKNNSDKVNLVAKDVINKFYKSINKNKKSSTKKKDSTKNKTVSKKTKAIKETPQNCLTRSGLEIYKTKDKNIEEKSKNEDKEGFVLQNGTITEIAYYDEMTSNSFEHDYEDISSNGSASFITVDETRFYKGKKVCLKKAHAPSKWNELDSVLLGFITEQSYSEDGVDIKITGMSKLLDQEKQFTYSNTKISKILKDMITSAGLKAEIDTTGLNDKKIKYTNVSSSSNDSSGMGSGSATIMSLAQEIMGDETDDYKKLEKGHAWGRKNISYPKPGYDCSRYDCDPDKCYQNRNHLNCGDTSVLMNAIYTAMGLESYINHAPGHFWVIVTINGKKYASDCVGSRPLGDVWRGYSPLKGSKANPKSICS